MAEDKKPPESPLSLPQEPKLLVASKPSPALQTQKSETATQPPVVAQDNTLQGAPFSKYPKWLPQLPKVIYLCWVEQNFKPLNAWFWTEATAMRKGWELFCFMMAVIIWASIHFTHKADNGNFQNQLKAVTDANTDLQGQLKDAKHDRDHYQEMLAPFEAYAMSKYSGNGADALKKLSDDISQMESNEEKAADTINQLQQKLKQTQDDLDQTKAEAAPNTLIYDHDTITHNSNSTITARIYFNASKNATFASIILTVQVPMDSSARITDIWPNLECGAFSSGTNSKQIYGGGTTAKLYYSPIGGNYSCVDVTVSQPTEIQIQGNNDLKTFTIDIN